MRHSCHFTAIAILLSLGAVALGTTLHVPTDFDKVQAAINAAAAGDTVVVAPGTYQENLTFQGRDITLTSEDPLDPNVVASTILQTAPGSSRSPVRASVVVFRKGETRVCHLTGFTIQGGYGTNLPEFSGNGVQLYMGGGVFCYGASPTISFNVFTQNRGPDPKYTETEEGYGGGLACYNSSALIANNQFVENYSTIGGAIMIFDPTTVVANNLIVDNSAWVVGGVYLIGGWFLNNTLVGNTAEWAVGHLYAQQYDGSLQGIHNNTFSGSPNGGGLLISGMEPGPIFSYNHIWGNQPVDFLNENLDNFDPDPRNWLASQGNITGDPRFVDPATGNFRLTQDSPCLNVGNPDFTDDLTPTDLDGNTRIVGKRVDIGAYESAYLPSILADAGEDQEVTVGTLVTLDGSGSLFPDPNNPKRLYLWDQITGPSVTLANPLTATPTFTPTQVAVYRFDLIVYDGKKASQPDEVIVTVIEDPNSPEE